MKRWAMILILGLAACSGPKYPTSAPARAPAPGAAPAPSPPASRPPALSPPAPSPPALTPTPAPPRSPVPRPEVRGDDQCGAAGLQRLVGRPRTEIPVPVNPSLQRVACNKCPVTLDYNPARLNFFFDADTGKITQVRCG